VPLLVFVSSFRCYLSLRTTFLIDLASILGQVIESLYSVKQIIRSRHTEANRLEEILDHFYLDLPEALKCDFTNNPPSEIPPPHVLTLNMQYWNAVLLLHRPLYVFHHLLQSLR
jgi:hypothetical protein